MRLLVRSLALLSGVRIRRCHELWCRSQTWLRLWHRPAATAPIRPLAWESPCAAGAALKIKKENYNHCHNNDDSDSGSILKGYLVSVSYWCKEINAFEESFQFANG